MIRDNLVVLTYYLSAGVLLAISGVLPGQGQLWRAVTLLSGVLVGGWGAWLYLFGGWHATGNRWLLLPAAAVAALIKAVIVTIRRPDPVPYPEYSPLQRRPGPHPAGQHMREPAHRAGSLRPPAHPESASGSASRPHDPWTALYASGGNGRRPARQSPPVHSEAGQVRSRIEAWRVPGGGTDRWRPPTTRP